MGAVGITVAIKEQTEGWWIARVDSQGMADENEFQQINKTERGKMVGICVSWSNQVIFKENVYIGMKSDLIWYWDGQGDDQK